MHTAIVLNALEAALYARQPTRQAGRIHHRDCGVQDVSIRDTERLFDAGLALSVGSVGAADDNALAETSNRLQYIFPLNLAKPWC